MKAILIDDEDLSLKTLSKLLATHCPEIENLGAFESPEEGREAILASHPDVVFLDIEMPGMNGFELLESLVEINFDVVFTTAYDEYAMRAFKVSAVDYLLKPIDEDELIATVDRIRNQKSHLLSPEHMDLLITNLSSERDFPKLAIPSLESIEFVDVQNITQCVADRNYTIVHTKEGEQHVFSRTLKEIEKLLPAQHFFRTHQSHLVNLNHIKKYLKGSAGTLILSDGTHARVAKSKKDALLDRIFRK